MIVDLVENPNTGTLHKYGGPQQHDPGSVTLCGTRVSSSSFRGHKGKIDCKTCVSMINQNES